MKQQPKTITMIWFNIKKLEALLIQGKVSDKLVFNYLLIYLIISALVGFVSVEDGTTWLLGLNLIISLGILIWGVQKTFQINQEGDNRDYFKRFICLAFVTGVRVMVYMFLFLLLITLFELLAETFNVIYIKNIWWEVFELLVNVGFSLFYYSVLLRSFRRVNEAGAKTTDTINLYS